MTSKVFRIDQFVVPRAAKAEFAAQVHRIHALLRTRPGFVQELLLEQDSGPENYRILTLVEWSGADALEAAKAEVTMFRAKEGSDPRELMARLGVESDLGEFRPLAGELHAPIDETSWKPALVELIRRYEAAFNEHDADAMNALFRDDASFVNFSGRLVVGREALHRAQAMVFAAGGPLADAAVEYTIESMALLTPEIAVVHAQQQSARSVRPPVAERDPMRSRFTVVAQRELDGWRIRIGQNTPQT